MPTKVQAVLQLIENSHRRKNSYQSYLRALRACKTLGLTDDEMDLILYQLDYIDAEHKPWTWLQAEIDRNRGIHSSGARLRDRREVGEVA